MLYTHKSTCTYVLVIWCILYMCVCTDFDYFVTIIGRRGRWLNVVGTHNNSNNECGETWAVGEKIENSEWKVKKKNPLACRVLPLRGKILYFELSSWRRRRLLLSTDSGIAPPSREACCSASCAPRRARPCLNTAAVVSRFSTHAGCGGDRVIAAAPWTTTENTRRRRRMRGKGAREFFFNAGTTACWCSASRNLRPLYTCTRV